MEYYPAIRRNEVLTYSTTWMNFTNFMLMKVASHKDHILYDSHGYETFKIGKCVETESRLLVAQA